MELRAIYEPVEKDMNKVEDKLLSVCGVDFPPLAEMLEYSLRGSGKRIRPALTLLSGKFYDYNLDLLIPMASAVEIMHTATLVHDDAIDDSPVRRGRPTVYKLWGVDNAVLLGDYMFAEAGALVASTGNLRAIRLFASTLKTISRGELNQAFDAFRSAQSLEQYYQRIARKTASLFVMAIESGAALSRAPEESIQILVEYGNNLGIAFQIIDDILDFTGTELELGKPAGSDLIQGTLTLPTLLFLDYYPEENPVKKLFDSQDRQDNIKPAIDSIRNSSVIQECYQVASDFCAKACYNLKLLPDNDSRQSLTGLADYIISRRK